MTRKMLSTILRSCAVGAIAAVGLTAVSHAQPNYGDADDSYTSGDIVVRAAPYEGRTFSGAPIVIARAHRVVDYGDLDLSTRWGVRALHDRVERAAADACESLDNPASGLYPIDDANNVDCINYAVEDAMSQAPITYADYGRGDYRHDRDRYDRNYGY